MASSTQEKMERAEAAARMAAAELSDINREQKRQQYGEEERGASKMESDQDQHWEGDDEKRGVIGNILKSVAETLEQTVTGRAPGSSGDDLTRREEVEGRNESPSPVEKAKQKAEEAKEKAEETKEKAKEKAEETKEKAKEKAEETKEKAREYKDSAKEKLGEVTGVDGREREREDSFSQPSREDGEREEERPGILGSLLKAVTGGNKRNEGSEDRTRGEEGSEGVTEKAREAKERAKEKAEETAEKAKEKTEETEETVKEKAKEYKDYTAEKAKETKDSTLGKVSEYKDSAVEKAKEVKDTAAEKAREAKERAKEKAEEMEEKAEETKEKAKEKTEETKEKAKEKAKETKEKSKEYKDSAAEKAKEAKENTVDRTAEKAGEYKETAAGKIVELKDTAVDKAKRAVEFFTGRRREESSEENKDKFDDADARRKMAAVRLQDEDFDDVDKRNKEVVEVVLVDVEGTPGGQAAAYLKAADQMTGQTFNDVGRLDDEGKGVVGVELVGKHPPAPGCPRVVAVERVDPYPEVECRGVLVMECDEDPDHRRQADK